MTEYLAFAATTAGVIMAVSPILQIRRMLLTRSSADFSSGYMALLLAGFTVWISYGIAIENAALVISNSASFSFGLLTLLIALRLRPRNDRRGALARPTTDG